MRANLLLAGAFLSLCYAQQDAGSVLPALLGDNLQGGSVTLKPFDLSITANATHAIILFNVSTPYSKVGWVAMGTGTRMINSDFLIVWPNPTADTYTLSHRTAAYGHAEPDTEETTQTGISIIAALSSNASSTTPYTQIAILRELTPTYKTSSSNVELQRAKKQQIVFGYSRVNPKAASIDASIEQHDQGMYGAINMDLSQPLTFATNDQGQAEVTPPATQPQETVVEWTRHDTLIVIHALCGALAWLIISPAMVLLGRLGRKIDNWVTIHRLFQVLLTVPLTLVCVILGSVAVNNAGGSHFKAGHPLLGLFILLIILFQAPLGAWIHHRFDAKRTKRPIRNVFHMVVGLTLTALGFAQVAKGMRLYQLSWQRTAPGYVWALFYIIVGCTSLAYLISVGRVIQQRKMAGYSWRDSFFGLGRNTPDPYGISPYAKTRKPPLQTTQAASGSLASLHSLDFDQHGHEMEKIDAGTRIERVDTINSEKGFRL